MSESDPAVQPGEAGQIRPNDLFTGREVARLLREQQAHLGDRIRWLTLAETAVLLQWQESRLRKTAARWREMPDPPVRVIKMGPGRKSHWLFVEADIYTLVRRRVVKLVAPEEEKALLGREKPDCSETDTINFWVREVTQNLD